MKTTLRSILQTAIVNGNDSIILGALGCGAFDTSGTAENNFIGENTENFKAALKELLQEKDFVRAFKNITLALLSFHPEEAEKPDYLDFLKMNLQKNRSVSVSRIILTKE